jgi:hypothetical protein
LATNLHSSFPQSLQKRGVDGGTVKNRGILRKAVPIVVAAIFSLVLVRFSSQVTAAALFAPTVTQPLISSAPEPQQYPIMDKIADKLILKYQSATCEQLWKERSQKAQPRSQEQQEMIQILRDDPKMRAAFLNKVAAPIANKMFECAMIP